MKKKKKMQVKNEFNLVDFQNRVKHLDSIYRQDVHEYVNNATLDEHTELANKVEDSGNELFHELEASAAKCLDDQGLSYASETVAEYCHSFINTLLDHCELMRDIYCDDSYSPSKTAYSSMQRMIKKYYPNDFECIRERFKDLKITTYGFDIKSKVEKMRLGLSIIISIATILMVVLSLMLSDKESIPFILGSLLLCVAFITTLYIPNPTSSQHDTFRIFLSIATAGVITAFPGFAQFTYSNQYGYTLTATGSLAIFLVVFFLNPAKLRELADKK